MRIAALLRALIGVLALWTRRWADRLERFVAAPAAAPSTVQIAAARRLYPGAPVHWLQSVAVHLDAHLDAAHLDAAYLEDAETPGLEPLDPDTAKPATLEEARRTSAPVIPRNPHDRARAATEGGERSVAPQTRARLRFLASARSRAPTTPPSPVRPRPRIVARFLPLSARTPDGPDFASPPAGSHVGTRFPKTERASKRGGERPETPVPDERMPLVFPLAAENLPMAPSSMTDAALSIEPVSPARHSPTRHVPTSLLDPIWSTDRRSAAAAHCFAPPPSLPAWPPLPPAGVLADEIASPPLPDLRRDQWSGRWNA